MSTESARLTTLDSGVRVVTEAMPSVRSIALGFWVRAGSRDEDHEHAGISHFLEHLLFKGTDRFSSREIDEAFDAMGAEVNAGTGKETTSVYSRFLDNHLERAFDVLQDMVLRPAYPDIDSERQVVIEEIAMYEDEPQDKVHDVLAGGDVRRSPAGAADHRPRRRGVLGAGARDRLVARRPLRAAEHRARRGRQPRARADRRAGGGRRRRLRHGAARQARRPPSLTARCCASTRRRPSSTTSASAGSGCRAGTIAASRFVCSTRSSAAPPPRGSFRRCARSAASPTRSTRTRATTRTAARWPCTWARGRRTWPRPWR